MLTSLKFLAGPTGGLAYHATALRYRHSRWAPFIRTVDRWLCEEWNPSSRSLIIFGPSAGWTLSDTFLSRFEEIIFVEPDPIARFLLARRRRIGAITAQLKFARNATADQYIARIDLLPWTERELGTFEDFLAQHPKHAILFSNVLGQLPLLQGVSPSNTEAKASRFVKALEGRQWASYHDIFSSHQSPQVTPELEAHACHASEGKNPKTLALMAFPNGGELTDHETLWLSEGRNTRLAHWELSSHAHHLIGFVRG